MVEIGLGLHLLEIYSHVFYLRLSLKGVSVTRNFSRGWGWDGCIPVVLVPSATNKGI